MIIVPKIEVNSCSLNGIGGLQRIYTTRSLRRKFRKTGTIPHLQLHFRLSAAVCDSFQALFPQTWQGNSYFQCDFAPLGDVATQGRPEAGMLVTSRVLFPLHSVREFPCVCRCCSADIVNPLKIFVGNLNRESTQEALQAFFGSSAVEVEIARVRRCALAHASVDVLSHYL